MWELYLTYLWPCAKSEMDREEKKKNMSKGNQRGTVHETGGISEWGREVWVGKTERGGEGDDGERGSRKSERERAEGGLESRAASQSEWEQGMCGTVSVYIELSVYVLTVSSVYLWRNSLFLFLLAPRTASAHNTLPKYPDSSVNCVSKETHCLYVKGKLQCGVLRRHIINHVPFCCMYFPRITFSST